MTNITKTVRAATRLLIPLLIQIFPSILCAQVIPALKPSANLTAFGTFSYGDSGWENKKIYGYTLGGDWQSSHIVGLEVRGSALSFGSLEHQYSAEAGVRAGYHFSRFSPYAVILGGAAHARWHGLVNGNLDPEANLTGIGPEWSIAGGMDWYLHRRLTVRLGEFSYSKIYLSQQNFSPWSFSSGIVYRLPFGR